MVQIKRLFTPHVKSHRFVPSVIPADKPWIFLATGGQMLTKGGGCEFIGVERKLKQLSLYVDVIYWRRLVVNFMTHKLLPPDEAKLQGM